MVIVLIVLIAVLTFWSKRGGQVTSPLNLQLPLGRNASDITLKTEYSNPFEPAAQYVNPFQEYKSPFQSLQ